jgi:hypothetical protein
MLVVQLVHLDLDIQVVVVLLDMREEPEELVGRLVVREERWGQLELVDKLVGLVVVVGILEQQELEDRLVEREEH